MDEPNFPNLNTKTIGKRIVYYKKVTSTNDLAWMEIANGTEDGVVVLAGEQMRGRGRFGRNWVSPTQKGIWLSVVLKPQLPVDKMFSLMAIGALAVADVLKAHKFEAMIRWPNDVVIKGKKIAGIIIETKFVSKAPEAAVLGIGMNVNVGQKELPDDIKDIATSALIENGYEIAIQPLTEELIIRLDYWYQALRDKKDDLINDAWRNYSAVLNKMVSLRSKDCAYQGKAVDLDPCKGIAVEQSDGTIKWWQGDEVELLRPI
ncbi:MAG: biotin--[acetyl-CoA-carboxylase] ligase [Candidatus Brocadiia bacterium]